MALITRMRWTPEELSFLKTYSQDGSLKFAQRLNRTPNAVRLMAERLGYVKNRRWTQAELNMLRRLAPKLHSWKIAAILHRTRQAVFSTAKRYGIKLGSAGFKNGNWVGNAVGVSGVHDWAKRRLIKPHTCQSCQELSSKLDLANKSGLYKRDLTDWEWLCRRCHMKSDGRLDSFRNNGRSFWR